MNKTYTIASLLFITFSIILGAIAAHSLEKMISADLILTFEKGVKYMMYSGLGLLTLSLNAHQFKFDLKWVLLFITVGTILFSGNIFIYIFHEQVPGFRNFVHIVPMGGTLMIAGWMIALVNTIRTQLK